MGQQSYVRDLTTCSLGGLTVDDIAYCHLSRRGWEPLKDVTIHTTLQHIETEMRQSRGTDLTSRYVPLLAAFSILEQLGDNYWNAGMPHHPKTGGGIEHALSYFCGYPPMSPEVKALYALRNGLVHAASLTSVDQGSGKRYIFRYDHRMPDPIVVASAEWDGQVSTVRPEVVTLVNPRRFTDQVSEAIARAQELFFQEHHNFRTKQTRGHVLINHLIWIANS